MMLSIIIVNWNTGELLCRCLSSIVDANVETSLEVIVVDNASKDGSLEVVQNRFSDVELIANPSNRGYIKACNQGIRVSSGQYLMLLNSDTEVLPSAIDDLLTFMEEHEEAGTAGPMLLNPDGSRQANGGRYNSPLTLFLTSSGLLLTLLSRQSPLGRWVRARMDFRSVKEMPWLSNACLIIRRPVIDQVGLLEEDYALYCSDCDWGYRARRAGWKNYYVPHAKVTHYGGSSVRNIGEVDLNNYATDLYYLDNYRFLETFWGKPMKWLGQLAVIGGSLIQMIGWSILYPIRSGQPRRRARRHIKLCLRVVKSTLFGPLRTMPWEREERR